MSRPNARKISPEFYGIKDADFVLNRAINANLEIIHPEILDVALDMYENAIRELRNLNEIAKITYEELDKEAKKRPNCEACIMQKNDTAPVPGGGAARAFSERQA